MKICAPTTTPDGLDAKVHNHFGSAKYFTIYDTNTDKVEVIQNQNEHHSHGTCQPLSQLGGMGIDMVLSSGMGSRAVMMLNQQNIRVFRVNSETLQEALTRFKTGGMEEITPSTGCAGHDCH